MNLGWQDLVALAIVLAAAGYLARLARGAFSRKAEAGCGAACGKCAAGPKSSGTGPDPVVSIGTIARS
jgi:hypothetical protein